MHQRIGVDHLDGTSSGQRLVDASAACLGRQQHQDRSQPFTRTEQAVSHRLDQIGGGIPFLVQITGKPVVDQVPRLVKETSKIVIQRPGPRLTTGDPPIRAVSGVRDIL